MQRPRRSTQTPEQALEWFGDFFGKNRRMPLNREIQKLRGPTYRLISQLGGIGAIAEVFDTTAELSTEDRKSSYEELIEHVRQWVGGLDQQHAPSVPQAHLAFQSGDLAVHPTTLRNRLGDWEEALSATGVYRFRWNASDCVRFAAQARQKASEDLDILEALEQAKIRGKTPTVSDIRAFYPDLRPLSRQRITWDTWQDRSRADRVERGRACVSSYAMLVIASNDGSMHNFQGAANDLYLDGRGPEFSRELFASAAAPRTGGRTQYIDALDEFEERFDALMHDRATIPLSEFDRTQAVLPVFVPEIKEQFFETPILTGYKPRSIS